MVVVVCTWYSGCMVWWWWVYVINQIWNSLVVESCFSLLFNQQAANPRDRARLHAAQGRLLIWDATCWDTMVASNIHIAMSGPRRVVEMAARRKREIYREILRSHHFVPVTEETMGSFGEDAIAFFHQVASRIQATSMDRLEYLKLCQRFSVWFNSALILGCCTWFDILAIQKQKNKSKQRKKYKSI